MRRRHLLAAGIGALAAPAVARADTAYPDHTIRLIVPFPAGGATDIVGRMFADRYCRTDDRMEFPAAPVVKAKAAE